MTQKHADDKQITTLETENFRTPQKSSRTTNTYVILCSQFTRALPSDCRVFISASHYTLAGIRLAVWSAHGLQFPRTSARRDCIVATFFDNFDLAVARPEVRNPQRRVELRSAVQHTIVAVCRPVWPAHRLLLLGAGAPWQLSYFYRLRTIPFMSESHWSFAVQATPIRVGFPIGTTNGFVFKSAYADWLSGRIARSGLL